MGETITFGDRLKMAKFVMTTKKFTNGDKVREFESEWNKWLGSAYSLYVSSGSTANFLLVAAVKEYYNLKAGTKVLLPGCTWMTNVAPIIQLGLTPIFCDINLENYSFDLEEAKRISLLHPDIKLIFTTHLLGFSANNVSSIRKMFPGALVIDDICESHGCKDLHGYKEGSYSLGATFSFYFGHHMSSIEGGMVSTYNSDLYDLMKMKRSHGLAREASKFDEYAKQYPDIDKAFLFMTDGYNFRNHEICAVLGLSQLKRLDDMIAIRRKNYEKYCEILVDNPNLFYKHTHKQSNSSFCFPFVCKSPEIMQKMKSTFAANGIEYRPIVSGNLLNQPFLKDYKLTTQRTVTNLDIIQKQGVYIGNNHFVTDNDMKFLREVIEGLQ
jgi:CDP-6-deoxy-D-xylo-4-hexulose-3-dehydrase